MEFRHQINGESTKMCPMGLYCGHMLLVILRVKKLLELFMKNNCRNNQTEFKSNQEKKQYKLYIKWKGYNVLLIVGLIEKSFSRATQP